LNRPAFPSRPISPVKTEARIFNITAGEMKYPDSDLRRNDGAGPTTSTIVSLTV